MSGELFDVQDNDIHETITRVGFQPIIYDPFYRRVVPLETYHRGENTIYVKDKNYAQEKVATFQYVTVRTADNFKIK